jgi:hypothetical protein
MPRALFLTVALLFALTAGALRAARLAIIVEDPRLSTEADLLTTELSKRSDLELLEREQILKVRKEQSLAAVNGNDYLKLGKLLGADGVLILDVVDETNRSLVAVRLAAVNPGVLLDVAQYDFPAREPQDAPIGRQAAPQASSARTFSQRSLPDSQEWCRLLVEHLDPLLPKLGVLVRDAVPISTLNIRSAAKTPQSSTIEQQLKFLLFQRLTRQKEIFVLEREKLLTLAEEKSETGPPDSPFWNGGYLLEGVIDRDGFNTNVLTLSVRLSPPAHGSPLNFEAAGPRTNLAAVIDDLAPQLLAALKTKSPALEWNSRAEAQRYFEEANWALRWKMLREAVTALEAAWALGKTDSNCASLRVENCVKLASVEASYGQNRMFDIGHRQWVPLVADPKMIRLAMKAMTAYQEFSGTLGGDLKPDSDWCYLGIRTLECASKVLQLFHSFPDSQLAAADELAELRRAARSIAEWMNRSPTVRAELWRPSKTYTHNDLMILAVHSPNILRCELDYGCFWQERPEDCLALYRELMGSPIYYYFHHELALRSPQCPRLSAWSNRERARASALWEGFLKELSASTNLHLRIEADFLQLADETTDKGRQVLVNRLMTNLFETGPSAASDSTPLLYMEWGAACLVNVTSWTGVPYETGAMLARPWTEHQRQLRIAEENASFEAQKQYLRNNTPFNGVQFAQTFFFSSYSKAQASELHPLLISYRSNLLEKAAAQAGPRNWTNSALEALRSVEYEIGLRLGINANSIASWMQPVPAAIAPMPQPAQSAFYGRTNSPTPSQAPRQPRNPGSVSRISPTLAGSSSIVGTAFHRISDSLVLNTSDSAVVHGHRVADNKLWLELRYGNRSEWHTAIAVFDPAKDAWDVIRCPGMTDNIAVFGKPVFLDGEPESSLCFQPFDGALYVSQWTEPLRKFDLKTRRWEILPVPVEQPTQLFTVNARLYGANNEAIFEILDGGHSTRLLASARRRPVSSRLDSFYSLGEVILFPGPANCLRAFVADKVFDWDGKDWNQITTIRNVAPPVIFADAAVFRSHDPSHSLWLLPHTQNQARLCWRDPRAAPDPSPARKRSPASDRSNESPTPISATPLWKTPLQLPGGAAVGALHTNLCIVTPHGTGSNILAELTWFGRGEPLTLHLRLGESDRNSFKDASRPFDLDTYSYRRPWLAFSAGVLILGHGRWNGVWTIPQAGLTAALASEQKRLAHSEAGD